MNKLFVLFIVCLILILFSDISFSQIYSSGSGDWSNPATWAGGNVPGSAQDVVIAAGHIVNIDNGNATCNSISFGDTSSHLSMGSASSVLSVYGNFTIYSVAHKVFPFNAWWPAGAKIKFTGSAAIQTLSGWNTAGSSTSFMEMVVDKSAGMVTTSRNNMRFSFGANLEIINGTFQLDSLDDIETRDLQGVGQPATMTIRANGIFNMYGGTSHYRKGTFTGEETAKSGIITVFGAAHLSGGSSNKLNLLGINIEDGGSVDVPLGRSTNASSLNVGTVTIKSGGTFINDIVTAYWYANATTPTTIDIQDGGELNITTSTFPMPQALVANGTVRYSKTDLPQTLPAAISTYNNLILSGGNVKTLGSSITVNGTLSLRGTANLALGGFTLNYAPTAILQYGSSGQISADTTTDAEWPSSGGPQNVTIYNSGGVTLHVNRTITGTLSLAGGVFDNNGFADDKNLTLSNGATIRRAAGSLSAAPSFAGNINLEYYSAVVSDTTSYEMPTSTSVLNNLTISSTEGVTLGSNVTVNGALSLTGSNLNTSLSKLLTLSASATISGGSVSSFVNGPLARIVATTSPIVNDYPIGKGTAYRPLQLALTQSSAASTVYTAEQFNSAPNARTLPGSLVNVASERYFNITKGSGANVTSASVKLNYSADDLISDAASLRIAKDNGAGAWVDLGGSGTAPTTGTITSTTNFTTFSDFVLANTQRVLTLKTYIEGFYNGSTMIPDTVTVELHNTSAPYALVDFKKGYLNTSGICTLGFSSALNGTPYYIAVKHRNAIETWSTVGQTFTSSALSYDFTSAQSQTYGYNTVQKGSKWCLYSGDVNHDGIVDSGDLGDVDNDNANYVSGYTFTDVNGDDIVDSGDLGLVDNNNSLYVGKITPSGALTVRHAKQQSKLNNKK
jgi:hypothetical protein